MKHSPGPWKWEPFLNWDGGLRASDGTFVIQNDETDSCPSNRDDATLIALAPEIREMLLKLEWGGTRVGEYPETAGDVDPCCPCCKAVWYTKLSEHAPGCQLAALLGKLR